MERIVISIGLLSLFIILMIWSGVWKAIALWRSARNKQLVWFIILCIFNTIGILEIIYLAFCQRDKNEKKAVVQEAPVKLAAKKAVKKKK